MRIVKFADVQDFVQAQSDRYKKYDEFGWDYPVFWRTLREYYPEIAFSKNPRTHKFIDHLEQLTEVDCG